MREENVIALKEIFANEVRMSLREIIPSNLSPDEVKKSIEVNNSIAKQIKNSFRDVVVAIDEEVLNIINDFNEDIELVGENDEYWGE
jgi:hypothetical protein